MSTSDFIPKRDSNLDAYEENFISKLDVHAETLELDPTAVTESKNILNDHRNSFTKMNSKKAESMSANEEFRLKKENALDELRRIAGVIKRAKKYTRAIGDDLGIIRPVPQPASEEPRPVLKAKFDGQSLVIKFQKKGNDGIRLFSKRGNEAEFTFLALDTESPYIDTRTKLDESKPEQRQYFAVFISNYVDIGSESDVIKAIVP